MERIKYLDKSGVPEIQIRTKTIGQRIDSHLEMIFFSDLCLKDQRPCRFELPMLQEAGQE